MPNRIKKDTIMKEQKINILEDLDQTLEKDEMVQYGEQNDMVIKKSNCTVAIIGSFQKYYTNICALIEEFATLGITTTSPYNSHIIEKRNKVGESGFVVFAADDNSLSDAEIQMDTLKKILKADAVYVYNPEGYVGRTTCYEIGVVISKRRPLYFYAPPADVPIPISERQVVDPHKLAKIIRQNKTGLFVPKNLSEKGIITYRNIFGYQKHYLLLCGSMKFYDLMKRIKNQMERNGIDTTIPADENFDINELNDEEINRFKRHVSNNYLRKIRDKNTYAILVVNEEKNGIPNYIGANTLVEIGMAFTWGKKIFIYNQLYEPLLDEMKAWGCEPLNGNTSAIYDYFSKYGIVSDNGNEQLDMFSDIDLL